MLVSEEKLYQEYEADADLEDLQIPEPDETQVKKRRLRFIVMTLMVTGLVTYLIYSGAHENMGYYLTVSELVGQANGQEKLRVSGTVEDGSINRSPGQKKIQFAIMDEQASLPVEYEGIVPDTLQQGQKVIVEGVYVDGTFIASELMTSCASKYE